MSQNLSSAAVVIGALRVKLRKCPNSADLHARPSRAIFYTDRKIYMSRG